MNEQNTTEVSTFMEALEKSFVEVGTQISAILPQILLALLVFIIGLIVAPVLGNIARKLVAMAQIDKLSDRVGLSETLRNIGFSFSFSKVIGILVKWFFIIVFLLATVEILGWTTLTGLIYDIVLYIPNVIVAVIIIAFGLIAGSLVEQLILKKIEVTKVPIKSPQILGKIARWGIVVFASLAALSQLQVAQELVQILFAGTVLALALAFGLGGREKAAKLLDNLDGSN